MFGSRRDISKSNASDLIYKQEIKNLTSLIRMKFLNPFLTNLTTKVFPLLLWFFANKVNAQNTDQLDFLKNVIPPSPNSASLGRYGDWPVSLYTGVPNISIPITTVQGRGISVPITISYHASGNKVADIASSVGLGWSLNAGGTISRSVRGLNDESSGLFGSSDHYSDPNDLSTVTNVNNFGSQRKVATADGEIDSEQDVYNFTALGRSYRLVLFADGSVQTIPRSNLKFVTNPIIRNTSSNNSWVVLLEDGTKLLFGDDFNETTTVIGLAKSSGGVVNYTSSWHLKSITATTGEVITFSYVPSTIGQDSYYSQSDFIKVRTATNGGQFSGCSLLETSSPVSRVSKQTVHTLNVASIESNLIRVVFSYPAADRLDLKDGIRLSEIKTYSISSGSCIEYFLFNTNYSQAVNSLELVQTLEDNSFFHKRLRLNSIERKSMDNDPAKSQLWTFGYDSHNLPSRRSFAQDHWGYFNGVTSNKTLLPKEYYNAWSMPDNQLQNVGFKVEGNREPAEAYMQAEILKEIHYPTGGSSVFNYEPNSAPSNKETFTNVQLDLDLNLTPGPNPFVDFQSASFIITKPSLVEINLNSQIGTFDRNVTVSASIINSSGVSVGSCSGNEPYWVNLKTPGTYTFKLKTNASSSDFLISANYVIAGATLTYPSSNGFEAIEFTGGLRIKSILNYDGSSSTPATSHYYEYANPLVISPVNVEKDYMTSQNIHTIGSNGEECFFIKTIRNSSSKYSTGSIQGGTTGYGQVTTKEDPDGLNGYIISNFLNEPDDTSLSDPHEFPYPPALSMEHRRGLLTTEKKLKKFNGQNILLKQTDNTYDFVYVNMFMGFKAGRQDITQSATSTCPNPFGDCGITQGFYASIVEQVNHSTMTETTYDENGQNPIITSTNYFYTSSNNVQPVLVTQQNSRGENINTYIRTVLEKADILDPPSMAVLDEMVNRNMVNQVIQKEIKKEDNLISRTTVAYSFWNTDKILPQTVKVQNGNNTPYTIWTANGYDSNCNLTDFAAIDKVNKSYLWDYGNSFPVAEITNATQNSVAFTSFESESTGNWTFNPAGVVVNASFAGVKSFGLSPVYSVNKSNLQPTVKYKISFWIQDGTIVQVNGLTPQANDNCIGWIYYELQLTGLTSLTITGNGNIDEVKLHPVDAQMATSTYAPAIGLTSQTDVNNKTIFYSYDPLNRLHLVKDRKGNIVKSYNYNYQLR
jgi:hypothetical protein